jgi:hypothetical protein
MESKVQYCTPNSLTLDPILATINIGHMLLS